VDALTGSLFDRSSWEGITGAGVAWTPSRATCAWLIDKGDFASGTSSARRSWFTAVCAISNGQFGWCTGGAEQGCCCRTPAPSVRCVRPAVLPRRIAVVKWRLGLVYDFLAGRQPEASRTLSLTALRDEQPSLRLTA
jgi:hypothetical protein